ncbi:hypothetical protein GW916_11610 [bacterium]|nr:hypothetical protein [bacterium]
MAKKRREIVDNLNLVPFIDLFSTLIIFLIATAVWDQLSAVPIQLGSTEKSSAQMSSGSEAKRVQAELKVTISPTQIVLFDKGRSRSLSRDEAVANEYALIAEFAQAARQSRGPDKKELVVEMADKAIYEDMIGTVDQFLAVNFDQLVILGAE